MNEDWKQGFFTPCPLAPTAVSKLNDFFMLQIVGVVAVTSLSALAFCGVGLAAPAGDLERST